MICRGRMVAAIVTLMLCIEGRAFSSEGPQKPDWTLENEALRVSVDAQTGAITVLDKQGGRKHRLPQDGFAVHGPRIEQSRELVGDRTVTTIRAGNYSWTDAK